MVMTRARVIFWMLAVAGNVMLVELGAAVFAALVAWHLEIGTMFNAMIDAYPPDTVFARPVPAGDRAV